MGSVEFIVWGKGPLLVIAEGFPWRTFRLLLTAATCAREKLPLKVCRNAFQNEKNLTTCKTMRHQCQMINIGGKTTNQHQYQHQHQHQHQHLEPTYYDRRGSWYMSCVLVERVREYVRASACALLLRVWWPRNILLRACPCQICALVKYSNVVLADTKDEYKSQRLYSLIFKLNNTSLVFDSVLRN